MKKKKMKNKKKRERLGKIKIPNLNSKPCSSRQDKEFRKLAHVQLGRASSREAGFYVDYDVMSMQFKNTTRHPLHEFSPEPHTPGLSFHIFPQNPKIAIETQET